MKKIIAALIFVLIALSAFFAFLRADRASKASAEYLQGNKLFEIKENTVTILNEEFRLK